MKKKSGHRRRTKVVRRSRKNLRRTVKRKSLGKGRRRPTPRYSRVQRGGDRLTDNLDCFVKVGDNYYNGDVGYSTSDGKRDYGMAVKQYTVAADHGNAEAQFKLGYIYEHGKGVPKNENEAVRLYKLAAAQNHGNAIEKMGTIYESGLLGVPKNENEAVRLYQLAVNKHIKAEAQFKLGKMYEEGRGVTQDINKAIENYKLAEAQGHEDARARLIELE